MPGDQSKEYRGTRRRGGCQVDVRAVVNGRPASEWTPLVHQVRHSPTGFEWGYQGSGPSDLARSILHDHLGHAAPPPLYQRFKFDVVAKMNGSGWTMNSGYIQKALDAIKAERGWTCDRCLDSGTVEAEDGRRTRVVSCTCVVGQTIDRDGAETTTC
jgi:hypothetical protein